MLLSKQDIIEQHIYFLFTDNGTFIFAFQSSYKDFIEEAQAAEASGMMRTLTYFSPENSVQGVLF